MEVRQCYVYINGYYVYKDGLLTVGIVVVAGATNEMPVRAPVFYTPATQRHGFRTHSMQRASFPGPATEMPSYHHSPGKIMSKCTNLRIYVGCFGFFYGKIQK